MLPNELSAPLKGVGFSEVLCCFQSTGLNEIQEQQWHACVPPSRPPLRCRQQLTEQELTEDAAANKRWE